MARIRDRSTTDLLVIIIAGTICITILGSVLTIAVLKLVRPDSDTTTAASVIRDTINTLVGLLAGFVAGRTEMTQRQKKDDADMDHE